MPDHQPCGLAHVLFEAPPLLAMLSSQDYKALSQLGRQLPHLIHSSITAVTVSTVSHAEAVLTGVWPQLTLIKLQLPLHLCYIPHLRLLQDSNFQLIASFHQQANLGTTQHWFLVQSLRLISTRALLQPSGICTVQDGKRLLVSGSLLTLVPKKLSDR